uniref:SWIM-type domain-containing protein n=1 Tax=Aplanochytrium stocchinoi TaxID=215587 RepID=A0A6S8BC42_9STRA|mmetsp:Transcript_17210/g.19506  ORF Transcript_17210/g.19506 Transcript_17210/m.19506 type:complete len:241 (+) Transcript_17210:109-831(+)
MPCAKVTLESADESQTILELILGEYDTNERLSSAPIMPGSDQSGNKLLSFGTCSCGVPNLTRIACPHMHAVLILVGSSEYYCNYYMPRIPTLNAGGNTLYSFSGGIVNKSILGPISLFLQQDLEEFQSRGNLKGDTGGVTKAHCRVLLPQRSWNEINEMLELKPPSAGMKKTFVSITNGEVGQVSDAHKPVPNSVRKTVTSIANCTKFLSQMKNRKMITLARIKKQLLGGNINFYCAWIL